MGTPKIKLYQLPAGYAQDGDSDVQQQASDELLPVVDRPHLLVEAVELTGVVPHILAPLQPLNLGAGRQSFDMTPVDASGLVQTPDGIDVGSIVNALGPVGVWVYDSGDNLVDEDIWSLTSDGFVFDLDVAPSGFNPLGASFSCYTKADLPASNWAFADNEIYTGDNNSWNKIWVKLDNGPLKQMTPATGDNAYVTTDDPVDGSGVVATYATTKPKTRHFIGDDNNWVVDHLRMSPDVFVGDIDYPGDATIVNNTPFEPGPVPKFREPGTYSLDARNGMVSFPEEVDSEVDTVRASYAHYTGLLNATGQRLELVDGTDGLWFRAPEDDAAFPDTVGRRWVLRNSATMPLNIYLNGAIVPGIQTTVPFDQLTVKTE